MKMWQFAILNCSAYNAAAFVAKPASVGVLRFLACAWFVLAIVCGVIER
jgi:hypothetical protein